MCRKKEPTAPTAAEPPRRVGGVVWFGMLRWHLALKYDILDNRSLRFGFGGPEHLNI